MSFDSLNFLKSYFEVFGVLYCFNVDSMFLELSDCFYYGIGGVSIFKNVKRLVEIFFKIFKNRFFLEMDLFYLILYFFRGIRNSFIYIFLIV